MKDKIIKRLYSKSEGRELPAGPDPVWDIALGQKYRVSAECLHTSSGGQVRVVGTVVWVHPKGRFALLEYRGRLGMQRECYHPMELTPGNRVS